MSHSGTSNAALKDWIRNYIMPYSDNEADPCPPQFDNNEYALGASQKFDKNEFQKDSQTDEVKEDVEKLIKENGFEAFAFYAPAHYYKKWGVYYIRDRISALSKKIHKSSNQADYQKTCKYVLDAIRMHEQYHFIVEFYASIIEKVLGREYYLKYCETDFKECGYNLLEEALANAYAASIGETSGTIKKSLFEISELPEGYKDYYKYLNANARLVAETLLANRINGDADAPLKTPLAPTRNIFFPVETSELNDILDEYWIDTVNNRASKNIIYFKIEEGVQAWVYIKGEHLPPHLHVKFGSEKEERYKYDELEPLPGSPGLSETKKRKLRKYIETRRDEIEKKLSQQNYKGNPYAKTES